jgi:predicted neuraminidase
MTKYDHDRGLWSPAKILVDGDTGGRGPVKNKIIVLADGSWLAPASLERDEGWDCFVDRSTDRGSTWRSSELVPIDRSALKGPGIIQPTLWQSAPNSIHMLARSVEGWIYRSDSCDNGLSWCRAYPITVPNNNSGLDLAKLDDGSLVLACNPVSEPGLRTPLCLFLSNDNGLHWELAFTLEDDPGEFCYPAIVQMKGGFGLSYTDRRIGIRYGQFIMKDMAIGGPRGSRR